MKRTGTCGKRDKLTVKLAHTENVDIYDRGGYWSRMERPKTKVVPVCGFQEASKVCVDFINEYDLGSGNWVGGQVFNLDGDQIANISYNGRVWDMKHKEIPVKRKW